MKHLTFLFFFITITFFSCNNNEESSKSTETITEEQKLINDYKQHPDSSVLFENLLQYYSENGQYDKGISTIDDAIKNDSLNARLWDIRSSLSIQKGDTMQAIRSLEKAIDLVPAPAMIVSLGALYAETRNPMALEMADALIIGDKAGAEKKAYFIKGLYYSFNNEKEKAIPFFDKCISIDYTFMEAYLEKAIALYDAGKYRASADVLEKAVKLQNGFERGYYYLGRAYEKLARIDDARNAYETAILYDKEYTEAIGALNALNNGTNKK